MPDSLHETLREKSIHDLRIMAQAFGVNDVFSKDKNNLIQEIVIKHAPVAAPAVALPPVPAYDARLMSKNPSKVSNPDELMELIRPYAELGLRFQFTDNGERWQMRFGERTDEGTMRMPLKTVIGCARRLLA